MENTIFIEKSYIVASILNIKSKVFNEEFTKFDELNYISDQIQRKLNEQNYMAIILDKIDTDYFDISDVIKINKSKGLSIESIINRYQGYLKLDILLLINNKEMLLEYLSNFKSLESINKTFNIMAVPCHSSFIVAPDKKEKFINQKPNLEVRQKMEEMGPVLKKLIKSNKK